MESISSVGPIAAIGDLTPQDRRAPVSPNAADVAPSSTPHGKTPAPTPATPAEVKAAVAAVNEALDQSNQGFSFEFDDTVDGMSIKIIDKRTNTVLRMVPSQEMLTAARTLTDAPGRGALLKSQA